MVKLAPFLATILCLWFGKFAMPVPGKVGEVVAKGWGLIDASLVVLLLIISVILLDQKSTE